MSDFIAFVLFGLGPGALIAALGLAVVITYRASGTINFAAGATATYLAYVFNDLHTTGHLFLPPRIALTADNAPVALVPALLIALAVAALLGLLQYLLIYRPLRDSGPLAKVVASSGVMLTLQAVILLRYGADTKTVPPILSQTPVDVLGTTIPAATLLLAGIVVVIAAALWALYRFTSFGVATRAAADNRKGAVLVGLNAQRLEATNWVLATVLAGLVGILAAPINNLDPSLYTLQIVPALGAALIGGFASFGLVTAVAFGIAIAQSLITWAQSFSWFPTSAGEPLPGVAESLPFFVIALALFFGARSLPDRQSLAPPRLPDAPRPTRVPLRFGLVVAAAVLALALLPFGWRQALIFSMLGMLICLSSVAVVGYLGQITFAQLAIAGVAGFMTSQLGQKYGLGFPIAPLVAVLVATVVSMLVAIPALRLRGMQLAVITLAAAVAIQNLWFLNPSWGGGLTGAAVDPPAIFGLKLGANDSFWNGDGAVPSPGFGLFILVVVVVMAWLVVNLRRNPSGGRFLSVRSNEGAAASSGVNIAVTKLQAFAISGAIAGVAGALYAYNFGTVTADRFGALTAVSFLAVAYLGGITTVTGSVIGGLLVAQGVVFYATTQLFGIGTEWQPLFAGVAVIMAVTGNPDGAAGFMRDRVHDAGRLIARRRAAAGADRAALAEAGSGS